MNMSAMKPSQQNYVAWSRNHKDKFIAISSDVKLFEFCNQQQQLQPQQPVSPTHGPTNVHQQTNRLDTGKLQQQHSQSGGLDGILARANKIHKQNDQFVNSRLVATGPEISNFKAAACYPGSISDDDNLVAVSCGGMQNLGKIVLICLKPAGIYTIDNFVHVDLVAKRAICNDISWSHVNNSLLATAWDRHKVDNSLQIFDINRVVDTGKYSFNFSVTPNNRPVFDGCPGDSINSLKWFRKEQSVVCGLNGKQIRIYDIRDLTKPKQTVATRAVHGLTVDAYSDKRFASYVDNSIFIWDSRMFDKPLVTITESKPASQISWCPTRNHSFSALMSGDNFVKIYDIQQACIFSEDFEAKIVERLIHPFASSSSLSTSPTGQGGGDGFDHQAMTAGHFGNHHVQSMNLPKYITSYDWHPTSELRLIAISNHRDVIALNICDRITLNWSPICEIVWTKGKRILQCLSSRDEKYKAMDDISVNMRHRAITNYGMVVEDGPHHQRGDDSDLIGLLRWVRLAKSLDISSKRRKFQQQQQQQMQQQSSQQSQSQLSQQPPPTEILGVGSLLRNTSQSAPSRAELKAINWKGAAATACVVAPIRFHVYHSELRSRALLLCDWIPDIDNVSQTIPIIDYLEKEGNYMRAAAIAVFNMRLQRAVESLTVGAKKSDPNLSSVAMALSGYTGERTSMWREMCQSLKSQLTNPYMKAMFAFLTSESDTSFHEIIKDTNLILADRVAFSLLYLPDDKLFQYLSETMYALVDSGDLNGILLTGITNDGLSLLQRYIEISSDIQSVSLIVLHSLPSAICNDPRAQLWVDCYRGMLDCWRLWHQRARFDNLWYSNSVNQMKPPNHISISCNYCGSAINKSFQQQPATQTNVLNSTSSTSNNTNYTPETQQQPQNVPLTISASSFTSNSSISSQATAVSVSTTSIKPIIGTTLSPPATSNTTTSSNSGVVGIVAHSHSITSISEHQQTTSQQTPSLGLSGSPGTSRIPGSNQSNNNNNNNSQQPRQIHNSSSAAAAAANARNRTYTNCKKCSFAKCCLCLTQLGSNQILFDNKNHSTQHINSKFFRNSKQPISQTLTTQAQIPSQVSGQLNGTNELLNNDTSTTSTTNTTPLISSNGHKINPFSNWFSWCQTCRHGAHSAHFLSWFGENSECPVSGCDCKCMNLDSRTKLDDVQRL